MAFVALFSLACFSLAHDTWILPDRPRADAGKTVRLRATSGMAFPRLEVAIAPDRIERAGLRIGGSGTALGEGTKGEKSLDLTVRPDRAGVAVAWLESKPRSLDLKPEQVEEYLAEIGAEEIAREWKANADKTWHETYAKHAKTFFRVGAESGDRSWGEPVGMAIEIVPEADPTRLAAGQELPARVFKDGRPLAGFPVTALAADQKTGVLARTDTEGRVRFRLDRAGWWLFKGTEIKRAPGSASDWESHFTTLTVFVGAP